MAFTQIPVTANYGTGTAGTVTFTLTMAMENSNLTMLPAPIVATVTNGALSQTLAANDDTATVPQGAKWQVTENIAGCEPIDYTITLSTTMAAGVDLSTLRPGAQGWA